jgi:hypothetical protein
VVAGVSDQRRSGSDVHPRYPIRKALNLQDFQEKYARAIRKRQIWKELVICACRLFSVRYELLAGWLEAIENERFVGAFFAREREFSRVRMSRGRETGKKLRGDDGCFRFTIEHNIFGTCVSILICGLFE